MSKEFWVEILRPGLFTDAHGTEVDLSMKDLNQIKDSHDEIYPELEPALRLGDHPGLEPGVKPAIGWVPKLKIEGERLFGMFTDIPEIVMSAFEKKLYKKVSAGLWVNHRHAGKTHPFFLNHVAVLGAELPAVSGLADLQAYLSTGTPLKVPEGVVCFTMKHEKKESEEMPTELEKRLTTEVEDLKGKNLELSNSNKSMTEKVEGLEKENKTMKGQALEFTQKAAQTEVETFVSQAIKDTKVLPKDKDAMVREGLALRSASLEFSAKDKDDLSPFDSWKARVTNGADAIDLSNKGKTGEEGGSEEDELVKAASGAVKELYSDDEK